ncbi:NGG1p interacting factor NIF3 [Candidatus Gottesmanbacteria bacterium RBG_16_52_11]|uniref:NGG1p interacting factor NIF3 n=1 Tax=Candidatus Gottesmanbacteria bacterium RBG_16_52_11 TaxID=1798374 RepID=A0A1F5YPF7_9BACT|nr:MAG: NGG1p interacting factor NIF3 [Candidatus Gottesmanbacteria bacterium RBG_16_52_11]
MTLEQIYRLAIEKAVSKDPRGPEGITKLLGRRKKIYDDLPKSKQDVFDTESLHNPYSDTRILVGKSDLKVDRVLAGIDINASEVLLADRLNQKGASIDLLIAHHPEGGPLAALHEVMDLQVDLLWRYGVPVNIGEGILRDRIAEVQRRFSPRNHNQAVDAAKLLGLALMCAHTATDNLVYAYLEDLFAENAGRIDTVGDVLEVLGGVPEYKEAARGKAGPMIFAGNEKNRAGKVAPVEITGGTEGSHIIAEKLAIAGVGTIVGMHASEEFQKECAKHHLNLVIAGHMSSDSLGMNLFLDELELRSVGITACSGLIRISRNRRRQK